MELFSAKPATLAELKAIRMELLQSPLKTADGKVFQFARDDRETMEGAIRKLTRSGGTLPWRQLDNQVVDVDAAGLRAYYDELLALQEDRAVDVDTHYMTLKAKSDLLQRDLVDWKAQVAADWWE